MSAYQVDPTTIDLMVSKAIELKLYAKFPEFVDYVYVNEDNATKFANDLWRENAMSIATRYHNGNLVSAFNEAGPYKFTQYDDVSISAAAGCVRCYEYQACEHPTWPTSDARDFCLRLNSELLKAAFPKSPWGVKGNPITQGFAKPRLTRLTDLIPSRRRRA